MDSRQLWLLAGTFVVALGGAAVAVPVVHRAMATGGEPLAGTALVLAIERPAAALLAATGLLVGVASPRPEGGWVPGRVVSTFLARGVAHSLALGMGLLACLGAVVLGYEDPALPSLVVLGGALCLYGLAFVAVGLSLAVWIPSRRLRGAVATALIAPILLVRPPLAGGSPVGALEATLRATAPTAPTPTGPTGGPVGGALVLLVWVLVPLCAAIAASRWG